MTETTNIKTFIQKRGELFIVLWILILSWVIVYSYFLSWDRVSRDAQRYANLLEISDQLKIFYQQQKKYPDPESSVNLMTNLQVLTFQWYLGAVVSKELWWDFLQDPLWSSTFRYLSEYTYAIDEKKQSFALMAFYENTDTSSYTPTSQRSPYVYGASVGIALEDQSQRPIQETKRSVDISNTSENYSIYMDNENILSWDKNILKYMLSPSSLSPAVSCADIQKAWWNKNGEYYINPLNGTAYKKFSDVMKVYCDLSTDGGWWTRLYYKDGKETCFNEKHIYNSTMIQKLFTKDFAVSDNLLQVQSEGSWILKNVDFTYKDFSFPTMANVANCKTPTAQAWSSSYTGWYLGVMGTLDTAWNWTEMFYGCDYVKKVWEPYVIFNIWWIEEYNMTWDFIHSLCSNYSQENHSITSRWSWDNTRVIWVR